MTNGNAAIQPEPQKKALGPTDTIAKVEIATRNKAINIGIALFLLVKNLLTMCYLLLSISISISFFTVCWHEKIELKRP